MMKKIEFLKWNRWPGKALISIIVGLLILLVGGLIWCHGRNPKLAKGIYMVSGGQSYLVLEPGWFGTLKVREGFMPSIDGGWFNLKPEIKSVKATCRNNFLFLTQEESIPLPDWGDGKKINVKNCVSMI